MVVGDSDFEFHGRSPLFPPLCMFFQTRLILDPGAWIETLLRPSVATLDIFLCTIPLDSVLPTRFGGSMGIFSFLFIHDMQVTLLGNVVRSFFF